MRLTFQILLLTLVVAVSGCATKGDPQFGEIPAASKPRTKPVVKPSDALVGRVVQFNVVGRFVILNFPVGHMPVIEQALFIYRENLKVGEVKITGPQQNDNIVADLVEGEAKSGDEVRDR
jgi:hypothetical protein